MLRAAGSFFIIAATTFLGESRASELRGQYRQLERLRQLVCRIQSEVRYARSPLEEIFRMIAGTTKEPYQTWLLSLAANMCIRNGETFAGLWETSVRENLEGAGLPAEEIVRLKELGAGLGTQDVQMQIRVLELYLMQLSTAMEEIREGMKTKIKLYHCLGFMSGMLIVILLL